MIYVGVGNAGCGVVWQIYEYLSRDKSKDRTVNYFVFADADVNNTVMSRIREQKLDRSEKVRLLELDRFWNGGCGVYHIIGELIAEHAIEEQFVDDMLQGWQDPEVTLVFSAGGGTGGGVGETLWRNLQAGHRRHVRAFMILPEVDFGLEEREGFSKNEINGPDDFQCISAGRLLTKLTNDAVCNEGQRTPRDFFILCNSALSAIPQGTPYGEAVENLNRHLIHAILLMPEGREYPAGQRLVTFGLGLARRMKAGKDDFNDVMADLARTLVERALGPLDLSHKSATGMSAQPVPIRMYSMFWKTALWDENSHRNEEARWLARILTKCKKLDAYLCCRTEKIRKEVQANPDCPLTACVERELNTVFKGEVPLRVHVSNWNRYPEKLFPSFEDRAADVALLLVFRDPIVEDIYRLLAYFIQSAFKWKNGGVDAVARLVNKILVEQGNAPEYERILEQITSGTNARGVPSAGGEVCEDPFLDEADVEQYPERIWGNIDDLKSKLLQVLKKSQMEFEEKLVTSREIAGALQFIAEQLWWRHGHAEKVVKEEEAVHAS